ncbi:MAG: hypothetical protein AAFQ21_07265 [Pseudomonadota bacterium]
MLNWLKSLFSGPPRARKRVDLDARLSAPDGGPLHGEEEFEAYDDGRWSFEVEVEHGHGGAPAGPLEAYLNVTSLGTLSLRGDESELKLFSDTGALPMEPAEGMAIDVRASGAIVVAGTFRRDY